MASMLDMGQATARTLATTLVTGTTITAIKTPATITTMVAVDMNPMAITIMGATISKAMAATVQLDITTTITTVKILFVRFRFYDFV